MSPPPDHGHHPPHRSVPRASGDEPYDGYIAANGYVCSPRERG